MCPEELNIRHDDENREQDFEYEDEEKKEPRKEQLVPHFVKIQKYKDFELKSCCTNFYQNAEGF